MANAVAMAAHSDDRNEPPPAELSSLAADQNAGRLEKVAEFHGPLVTGIAVSREGRIFVSFPRWTDPLQFTVGELKNGEVQPYPDAAIQDQSLPPQDRLISVQSVVVDADNRLWLLDSGTVNQGPVIPFGAKLIAVDLNTNRVIRKIFFPDNVVLANTYLNDVRFDLKLGQAGVAFISDSSPESGNAIIVVDLATGQSYRRLAGHPTVRPVPDFLATVEGRPLYNRPAPGQVQPFLTGVDGIAVSADGNCLFYSPLSSRHLYSVDAQALADPSRSEADVESTVVDHGQKGTANDGMETDDQGALYLTAFEHDAILRRRPDGHYETVVHDPHLLWPDSMAISTDGYLYFTVNQLDRLPRFHDGHDLRRKPWVLFRTKIGAGPSLLAQPQR